MIRNLWLLALLPVALVGCSSGGTSSGGSSSVSAPVISGPVISPAYLSSAGGTISIDAVVQTSGTLAWVRATVTKPDGGTDYVNMTYNASGYYEGSYYCGANVSSNDQVYSVTISAADTAGHIAQPVNAGSANVSGNLQPPPPPAL